MSENEVTMNTEVNKEPSVPEPEVVTNDTYEPVVAEAVKTDGEATVGQITDASEPEVVSTPTPDVIKEDDIPDPVEEIITSPRQAVLKAFRKTGIKFKEDEVDQLVEVVKEYHADHSIPVFGKMPKILQNIIKISCRNMLTKGMKNVNREDMAKVMLDDITHVAGFEVALTNLKDEMKLKLGEANKELRELVDHAYKSAFDNIEDIRKENPEKAEKIEKVQKAFEMAANFNIQKEYLDKDTPRNVKRYHQHYNSDVSAFRTKTGANAINLTIPSLDHLLRYLQVYTKQYDIDVLKGFVVLIARSTMDLDFSDLQNTAYVYKLMANIYQYGATPNQKSDTMLKGAIEVLDKIKKIMTTKPKKK